MSYHVENPRIKELPEQLIVREDGYMDAYKSEGVPIVDYVYTLGGGECEIVRKLDLLVCTACNRAVGKADNDCPDGGAAFFRFCPKCGKKAKR